MSITRINNINDGKFFPCENQNKCKDIFYTIITRDNNHVKEKCYCFTSNELKNLFSTFKDITSNSLNIIRNLYDQQYITDEIIKKLSKINEKKDFIKNNIIFNLSNKNMIISDEIIKLNELLNQQTLLGTNRETLKLKPDEFLIENSVAESNELQLVPTKNYSKNINLKLLIEKLSMIIFICIFFYMFSIVDALSTDVKEVDNSTDISVMKRDVIEFIGILLEHFHIFILFNTITSPLIYVLEYFLQNNKISTTDDQKYQILDEYKTKYLINNKDSNFILNESTNTNIIDFFNNVSEEYYDFKDNYMEQIEKNKNIIEYTRTNIKILNQQKNIYRNKYQQMSKDGKEYEFNVTFEKISLIILNLEYTLTTLESNLMEKINNSMKPLLMNQTFHIIYNSIQDINKNIIINFNNNNLNKKLYYNSLDSIRNLNKTWIITELYVNDPERSIYEVQKYNIMHNDFEGKKYVLKQMWTYDIKTRLRMLWEYNITNKEIFENDVEIQRFVGEKGLAPKTELITSTDNSYIYIIEKLENTIEQYIKNTIDNDKITQHKKYEIINEAVKKIFDKLNELHEIGIIHGNSHARNFMIDKSGKWFIIDFGNSKRSLNMDLNEKINLQILDKEIFINSIRRLGIFYTF